MKQKRLLTLLLSLLLLLSIIPFNGFFVQASSTEMCSFPKISGKYMTFEIAEAIANKDVRSLEYATVLKDLLLPTSMGIKIPHIDPNRIYQTVDVYTLDVSFSEALSAHGVFRKSMSYSEYELIESTWQISEDMFKSIQRAYPELKLADISNWTYGDYKEFCKKKDFDNLCDSITVKQMKALSARNILISDLQYLLKEYHTIDNILEQPNSSLKQTLEDAYQFTIDMVGLSATKANPPSNKYTYVYFPRYNNGNGDYFLNDVLTTTYWQGVQADRALRTQQVLYDSSSTTLRCTNMYGTYSYSQGGAHEGIDFVHPNGTSTPTIYAVFEGTKKSTSLTHHLAVYDVNSPDEPKTYSYLHMNSISAGSSVSVYNAVGRQGKQGNATGYHVHFEVHAGETTALSSGSDHVLGSISPYRLQDYIGELE